MDAESVSQVQRKIELQSPEDLSFLVANARRGAAARLDEAFPPVARGRGGGEPDELRDRIAALVDAYVTRTFALAAPNLLINGLAVPPHLLPDEQAPRPRDDDAEAAEAFDARKRQRVAALVAAEEKLLEDVAALSAACLLPPPPPTPRACETPWPATTPLSNRPGRSRSTSTSSPS